MIVLGLTGSIGMGKSTMAKMFAEAGVPVHDSDEAVHRLYAGKAAPLVEAAFPGTTIAGVVDRAKLGARVLGDAAALKRLEAIIHPLVRADANAFLARHRAAGAPLAVLDRIRNSWLMLDPTGRIILPPTANCSTSAGGISGGAAVTMIFEKGACSGQPW